ncbi:MAG TPA: DUF2017 domain-containing protein [Trebonia sp.]
MFRSTKGGGASAWMSAEEANLLRALVVPVTELLNDPARPTPPPEPASGSTDLFDDLEKMFNETTAEPPEAPLDPVLARLLPDAYRDDPDAAGEFRKYTESSLREAKKYFAQTVLETLPAKGGRVKLNADQARDWLRALNDVRLMFGVRLEVTESFEEQLATLDPKDPRVAAFEVYGWLGAVQESLVRAITRLSPGGRPPRAPLDARPMAKPAIVSAAHPAPSRGDDPPCPPMSGIGHEVPSSPC